MDFEREFSNLRSEIVGLNESIDLLDKKYQVAAGFTGKLLEECQMVGIDKVSIGIADKSVPASMNFSFGARGSVFAMGTNGSWPAIWGAVERSGIKSSCGNSNQKQLNDEEQVVDGVYHLKDGQWKKVR